MTQSALHHGHNTNPDIRVDIVLICPRRHLSIVPEVSE